MKTLFRKQTAVACNFAVGVAVGLLAVSATADTLVITSTDDNTLIEAPNGAFSGGASGYFFAGRVGTNGEGKKRRGVMKFDLSAIPTTATIQSVSLKLYCSAAGLSTQFPIALKRMLASWGEGSSFAFGGGGALSEPGDATWLHRFYPTVFWSTPGGEFVSTASATKNVGGQGYYTWTSTASLVTDVQAWVALPDGNFGWLVQGNETTLQSVKRFDSHEAGAATQPQLTITYSVAIQGDLNGDSKVDAADLAILLGAWGQVGPANLDNLGVVDAGDLAVLLGKWTG